MKKTTKKHEHFLSRVVSAHFLLQVKWLKIFRKFIILEISRKIAKSTVNDKTNKRGTLVLAAEIFN